MIDDGWKTEEVKWRLNAEFGNWRTRFRSHRRFAPRTTQRGSRDNTLGDKASISDFQVGKRATPGDLCCDNLHHGRIENRSSRRAEQENPNW